jgi:hypothetical protein
MATKKKEVKVRDLKPSKDAKGGAARNLAGSSHRNLNSSRGGTNTARGGTNTAGRTLQ